MHYYFRLDRVFLEVLRFTTGQDFQREGLAPLRRKILMRGFERKEPILKSIILGDTDIAYCVGKVIALQYGQDVQKPGWAMIEYSQEFLFQKQVDRSHGELQVLVGSANHVVEEEKSGFQYRVIVRRVRGDEAVGDFPDLFLPLAAELNRFFPDLGIGFGQITQVKDTAKIDLNSIQLERMLHELFVQ